MISMTVLTEEECKLIRDRLRKHLEFWQLSYSHMTGPDYLTPLGVETVAKARKEVNDTLEALSLL